MSDDDFYVEDEPIKEARANWRRGEKGVTKGPRDLNQRAKGIVDAAVAEIDAEAPVNLTVVAVGTTVTDFHTVSDPRADLSDENNVTESVEYLVSSGT